MNVGRIGQSSFVAIFVILAAALTVTGWYHSQTTAAEQQQAILEQTDIDMSEANLDNLQLYAKTSLGIAASQAAGETGKLGGRMAAQEEEEAEYWHCGGEDQVPDTQTMRYTMSNFTMEFLDPRLSQIHGQQGEYLYQVGEQTCAEVGYRTPVDDPDQSDNFLAATNLAEAGVYQQDGSAVREDRDVSISERIEYNRIWFMHDGVRDWFNQAQPQGFKQSIRTRLQEVPDVSQAILQGCGSAECPNVDAPQWTTEHPDLLTQAVEEGINEQLDTLETEYLDQPETDREIQCEFEFNEAPGDTDTYPTYRVNVHGAGSDVFQDDGGTADDGGEGDSGDESGDESGDGSGDESGDESGNETSDGGDGGTPDPNCREANTSAGCNCQEWESTCASYEGGGVETYPVQGSNQFGDPQTDGGGGGGGCGQSCVDWGDESATAIAEYAYTYDVWADFEVTCRDRRFESVVQTDDGAEGADDGDEGTDGDESDDGDEGADDGDEGADDGDEGDQDEFENQVLNFKVSFMVSEESVDHEFVCEFNQHDTDFEDPMDPEVMQCDPVEQKEPHELLECAYEDPDQQMCDTGINTVERTE